MTLGDKHRATERTPETAAARMGAVPGSLPLRNVSLIPPARERSAKTSTSMQLGVQHAWSGVLFWLGTFGPSQGPISSTLYELEDEGAELHRRFADIEDRTSAGPSPNCRAMCIFSRSPDRMPCSGMRHRQSAPSGRRRHFHRLREAACDIPPKMIALDIFADIVGGNENDRAQVRELIGLMRAAWPSTPTPPSSSPPIQV